MWNITGHRNQPCITGGHHLVAVLHIARTSQPIALDFTKRPPALRDLEQKSGDEGKKPRSSFRTRQTNLTIIGSFCWNLMKSGLNPMNSHQQFSWNVTKYPLKNPMKTPWNLSDKSHEIRFQFATKVDLRCPPAGTSHRPALWWKASRVAEAPEFLLVKAKAPVERTGNEKRNWRVLVPKHLPMSQSKWFMVI